MAESLCILFFLFAYEMVFGTKKNHKRCIKIIKLLGRFFNNVIKLNVFILKRIYDLIMIICWNINFKGFKTPEQVRKEINNMQSRKFEIYCANLFKKAGFKVKVTPNINDYGRDIILKNKDNETIYVECKRWNHNNGLMVGREICEKLIGSCASFKVNKCIIINTGDYHRNAYEYANRIKKTGNFELKLWDTECLINLYKQSIKNKEISNIAKLN